MERENDLHSAERRAITGRNPKATEASKMAPTQLAYLGGVTDSFPGGRNDPHLNQPWGSSILRRPCTPPGLGDPYQLSHGACFGQILGSVSAGGHPFV